MLSLEILASSLSSAVSRKASFISVHIRVHLNNFCSSFKLQPLTRFGRILRLRASLYPVEIKYNAGKN